MKKIILFMLSPCWEQLPCSVPIISNTDRCGRKNERKPASPNVSIPFGCTSSEKKPVLIKHYDYREMSHSYTWLVEKFSCWVKLSLRLTESQQEVRRGFGNYTMQSSTPFTGGRGNPGFSLPWAILRLLFGRCRSQVQHSNHVNVQ